MNLYPRTSRIQTGIILLLCFAAFILTVVYRYSKNNGELHDLTCRSAIEIVRNTSPFRGIIDIKAGGSKGIVNTDGITKDTENNEQTVQRMALFTQSDYGSSLVRTSRKIQIPSRETAPASLVQEPLPDFFLTNTSVFNVDFFALNSATYLITKEGIPYLYRQNYALSENE